MDSEVPKVDLPEYPNILLGDEIQFSCLVIENKKLQERNAVLEKIVKDQTSMIDVLC